jgi:pantetheine-phosphate adenylyltransferase
MKKIAVYPGSFDPITNGHIDLIRRAQGIFDDLIVAVAINPRKKTLFTPEERVELIREALGEPQLRVDTFSGLMVQYLERVGAKVVIRGLRAISDFDYEFQIAITNRNLKPDMDTLFLMASEPYIYLSSRMVKEILYFGGDVSSMVPASVLARMQEKMAAIRLEHL